MLKLVDQNDYDFFDSMELEVFAKTIWGEAKFKPHMRKAVANVIMNRLKVSERSPGYWWGNNIVQICQRPFQFKCWNRSGEDFRKVVGVTESDFTYRECMKVAQQALSGELSDITNGSTHYHHESEDPYWAFGILPEVVIDHHRFFKMAEVAS